MSCRIVAVRAVAGTIVALVLSGAPAVARAQTARDMYTRALARERAVRDAEAPPTLRQVRAAIAAYERLVRKHPASGYSDNALWQAGNLALLAFQRFGQTADREAGLRLLNQLKASYPSSSLLARMGEAIGAIESRPSRDVAVPAAAGSAGRLTPVPALAEAPPRPAVNLPARSNDVVTIRGVTRTALTDGVRVSIEMDGEALYHQERLENPSRIFFDVKAARPAPALVDAALKYSDDVVREIRLGRHPQNTTRVVMDAAGIESYTVFTLYNPYRIVVDFRRVGAVAASLSPLPLAVRAGQRLELPAVPPVVTPQAAAAGRASSILVVDKGPLPLASRQAAPPALSAPAVPAANSNGQFSLARQLGLGVSRIVIDAGHGGHDPGAHGNGINESELVLDVALRARAILAARPGVDVVMTRDTDVFIPLEERTAIANRQSADLFLSIHANASRNSKAHGIETYFLNFASNPEAEAVAARENSASGKTMHSLPEIVRAIALNNKIDESRDFADTVQKSMVRKLAARNAQLKDLGVKQAPFVVLIGAGMPSVLAEISFVTNRQEGQLLKTPAYRQQIAEALADAVVQYQKSLKMRNAIADARE
jgi:N-acetylmuramoyl-L-alanine amidase